ncbi:DUF4293 domain-containing protein [Flavobacteriales bacterium]|nr:DUF4293 domain-containing protein [Flavobacteriales bacterium]
MIQRIQTVYLAISAFCLALTFFISFSNYDIMGANEIFNATGINFEGDFTFLPVIFNVGLSIIFAFVSIISFKNRKTQLKLNLVNYLIIIALIVLIFINFNGIENGMELSEDSIHYGIGMFLPIISLVCLFMANRAIKSDERLIKSMDRIR